MKITVNGTPRDVADDLTVAALVVEVEAPDSGIAIAIDSAIVPRAAWATTRVADGATVEILTAVQGG